MLGSRGMSRDATIAAVACAAFAAGLILLRDQTFALRAFDDVGMLLFALAASMACAAAARRAAGRTAMVMWLLSAKSVMFVLGQIFWTWYQLSGQRDIPFPSLADLFFLSETPFLLAAVFLLSGSHTDRLQRFSAVIEGALTACALLFIIWVLFLDEAFRLQATASPLAQAISLAYPLSNGAAAAALVVMLARRAVRSDARLRLIAVHVVLMSGVWLLYAWQVATGRYQTGGLLDVGWPVSFALLILAARAQSHPGGDGAVPARATLVRGWSPFIVTLLSLVVAVVHVARGGTFGPFELWVAMSAILLMLTRQALGVWDYLRLNHSLEVKVARRTVELRASRERYRSVIDNIGEIIFILDPAGSLTYVNNAWEKVTGIAAKNVMGESMLHLIHPDDCDVAVAEGNRLLAGNDPDPLEIRLLAADGSTRWLDVRVNTQLDEAGELAGWSGTMVDVTVRKLAAAALLDSEQRWRLLLESSGEGTYGIGLDGICTFINAAASDMLGYPPGALLGHNIHDAVHHSRRDGSAYPRSDCPIQAAVTQGLPLRADDEWLWRLDGTPIPVEISAHPIVQDGQITGAVVTFADISARLAVQAEIRHRSLHDGLTGLPNRTLITEQLQTTVTGSTDDTCSALLILDLDRFKEINDTFGHPVGDLVLKEIARRMSGPGLLRVADSVGRLGGDEFAVVLAGLSGPQEAARVADKIVNALSQPIAADGHEFQVGCSIGIAVAPVHGSDPTVLLQRADIALYVAKAGEQSVSVYTPEADSARVDRLDLIQQLRTSISDDQLMLHYQPIVELATGRLTRLEALVRWNHPRHGLILPDAFVPLAEQAGVIMPLTTWALRDALRQSRLWRSEGMSVPIAVNISAQTLHDPRLQATVEEWYAGPTPPGPLELEITESAVLTDPDAAVVVLSRFVAMGVRIAIDDFGTGYSSLAQLKRLPVHAVKVDKSFIAEMHTDERDESIVRTVIALGHTLGLDVVAEGVETAESAERLRRLGCDLAQGWHFGAAQPAADITAVLLAGEDAVSSSTFDAL